MLNNNTMVAITRVQSIKLNATVAVGRQMPRFQLWTTGSGGTQ